jgi:membrane protease YdiL (CAAX protease family)
MTTTTAPAPQPDVVPSGRSRVASAWWFVGIMLVFALIVTVAVVASDAEPTLLAFPLAIAPAVIAIGLAWREGNGAVGVLLRQLIVLPKRPIWYLTLLLPAAAFLVVAAIAVALGEPLTGLFDGVFPAILIVPLVVLLPAFTEELAWRGFALPRAISVMSPVRAALVLGVPWTLIHVGLFLPGQMNAGASYWSMVTQIMSLSVVLTWVYFGTGRSVLMAGLVHALFNGMVPLTGGIEPELAWTIRGVVWPVLAIAVVALGGFRGLEGEAPRSERDQAPQSA